VSANPADVVPGSDIVIWCGPVVATKEAFEKLAPFVQPTATHTVYMGVLFAQGCVHLLAKKVLGPNVPFFAFQNIPWLCRTITPGKVCEIIGKKKYTSVATSKINFSWLRRALEPNLGNVQMMSLFDFSAIVLNPANQIIHPARYWGIFKDWNGQPYKREDVPWLYRDFDAVSAEALEGLDVELQTIKKCLEQQSPEVCFNIIILLVHLLFPFSFYVKIDFAILVITFSNN
jgi:opine dehydrogenase